MHGHAGRFPTAAALASSANELVFLGLHRQRRDFSDQDIADLAVLQRVISPALAYRAALDAAIAQLQRGIDQLPSERPEREGRASQMAMARSLCRDFRPTRREAEVLCLLTAGWTDRQIARRLGITVRTVRKHLSQVFDKAGVRGRAAVAAWWQRNSTPSQLRNAENCSRSCASGPAPKAIPGGIGQQCWSSHQDSGRHAAL